jgi:uncharacterized protein (DUF433 family)
MAKLPSEHQQEVLDNAIFLAERETRPKRKMFRLDWAGSIGCSATNTYLWSCRRNRRIGRMADFSIATFAGSELGKSSLNSPHLYIKRARNRSFVDNENLLDRITIDPEVMVGKPVIKGTKLRVEYILGLLAHGTTIDEILEEYPSLLKDDIYAGLLFASKTLADASFVPLKAEAS